MKLNEYTILLDGSLTENEAAGRPHTYRKVRDAFECEELKNADREHPVTMYIAPGVYWIDDPGATDTLHGRPGDFVPIGIHVSCAFLKIAGLSKKASDVVIAGNRGQSHAADGNYTMFFFHTEELWLSNLTLGNYCSVDLVYSRDITLNYPKRTEAVTQAQLAFQKGEKLYAENCSFVSRLNLCPVCGANRALYRNCHFESTDDALNGNAVYLGCDFDFYGNRPIYQAVKTGVVFLDCLFCSRIKSGGPEDYQYLTKEGGPVVLVDCRYEAADERIKLGWTKYPRPSLKCYQFRVTFNGQPVFLGSPKSPETIGLEGKRLLEAFVYEKEGRSCYNIFNLLGGNDGWNPTGASASSENAGIPTYLEIAVSGKAVSEREEPLRLVSGEGNLELRGNVRYFYNSPCSEEVEFYLDDEDAAYASLTRTTKNSCILEGHNHTDEGKKVVVHAGTRHGLEAAAAVRVEPFVLEAPCFVSAPKLTLIPASEEGSFLAVRYLLSGEKREDCSEIRWYRCDGRAGENAVLTATSKCGRPLKRYRLSQGDAGKYIMAEIVPKLSGSLEGKKSCVIMREQIAEKDFDGSRVYSDFSDIPSENQPEVEEGRWTFDCGKPADIESASDSFGSRATDGDEQAWKYGETGNGSVGLGLYQNTQGARIRYTPVAGQRDNGRCGGRPTVGERNNDTYGDMSLTVTADPAKTAGQGFGSAGQYMDIGIKFDTRSLTGYALRILRSKEASDAVFMALVEYCRGEARYLTARQVTSCFVTGCRIVVKMSGNRLTAVAETASPQPEHQAASGYAHRVNLEAEVEENPFGGILIWHTGTPGTGGWQNTTMLHNVEITYGKGV